MAAPPPDQILFQAHRLEQLGFLTGALAAYRQVLQVQPKNMMAAIRCFRLARDLTQHVSVPIKLIWQTDPTKLWESDWVRYLLSSIRFTEIVDCNYVEFHDAAIIVDSILRPAKTSYYFEMLKRGHRFGLFHLSDEHYVDDCTSYQFSNFVLRSYWSASHVHNRRVLAVPLGTFNGFHPDASKSSAARRQLWSFAGEVNKSSRGQMLNALKTLEGGFVHPTGASSGPAVTVPPLSMAEYAKLLSDSDFRAVSGWSGKSRLIPRL